LLTRAMIYGIAACCAGFLIRYGGMVSFGQAAFFGLGSYTGLVAQMHGLNEALVVWPLAMGVGGTAAFLVGALSLRVRGMSFIMITLGFAQMVYLVLSSLQPVGAADGLGLAGRNVLAGAPIDAPWSFHLVVLAVALATLALAHRVAQSHLGLVLAGIRQNEQRVLALGYDTNRSRLIAFVAAGAITGLAGALAANFYVFVSPAYLHWIVSGEILVMATLGGLGSLAGGLLGALVFLIAEAVLSDITTYWRIVFGPMVVVAVLFLDKGLYSALNACLLTVFGRVAWLNRSS